MLNEERQDGTTADSSTRLREYLQSADITQMQLLGAVQTYFVEFESLSGTQHCNIGATSYEEARMIFNKHFPIGRIVKIQTVQDVADEISNKMIEVLKRQLNCT